MGASLGVLGERRGAFWKAIGGPQKASWEPVGGLQEPLEALHGRTRRNVGRRSPTGLPLGAFFGRPWIVWGAFWRGWVVPGGLLGTLRTI